jgi:hypothetical protein
VRESATALRRAVTSLDVAPVRLVIDVARITRRVAAVAGVVHVARAGRIIEARDCVRSQGR